jgi:hypothetical protein
MPLNEIPEHFNPETLSSIEAALEDAWQELSKGGDLEATLARKKLRTTMVALASVGETDHRKLKLFAIHAWRGAMQAAPPAIAQRAGRSETAGITPAAAEQSQEVRAR